MLSTSGGVSVYIRSWKHAEKQAKVSSSLPNNFDDDWGRLIHERDLFPIEWRQQIEDFWLAINVHNFKELPTQELIVFINWSKQFQFGVVKIQVRVNGLPVSEIHESRQTTQLFSTKYWGGFHAELLQIKVDSTSGIKHNMVITKFWMRKERTTIIPFKKGIFKRTHRRYL